MDEAECFAMNRTKTKPIPRLMAVFMLKSASAIKIRRINIPPLFHFIAYLFRQINTKKRERENKNKIEY